MQTLVTRADRMRRKLHAAFAPLLLEIEDDSARHAGHAGAQPGGETHYTVRISSAAFTGKSRIDRQRAVHEVLAEEFVLGLHALSLVLRTPEEQAAAGS